MGYSAFSDFTGWTRENHGNMKIAVASEIQTEPFL
jgi:hypothetical protein